MFGIGGLIGKAIKLATVPIDIAEVGLDLATGGDGSRDGLKDADLPMASQLRDAVVDVVENIDKKGGA